MKKLLTVISACFLLLISQQIIRPVEDNSSQYQTFFSQLFIKLQGFFTRSTQSAASIQPAKKDDVSRSSFFNFTYNSQEKIFTILSPAREILYNVTAYQLSPQKKYFLIFQETSSGIASRATGQFLGEKISKRTQLLLYNAFTAELHASFDLGIIRTFLFDPSEDLLMIAGPRKPWGTLFGGSKASAIHISPIKNFRKASDSGEILQYQIFDVTSRTKNTPLKTIENVQAIQFSKNHELLVKYDDGMVEKIEFKQTKLFINTLINPMLPDSLTDRWDITTTILSSEDHNNLINAFYDEAHKRFKVTIPSLTKDFKNIISYQLSPEKKFISVCSLTEGFLEGPKRFVAGVSDYNTVFINTESGIIGNPLLNVIYHMFNADESRLIVFYTPIGWIYSYDQPEYHLFDTSSQKPIHIFKDIRFAYFEKSRDQVEKLIIIDNEGNKKEYETSAALSYEKPVQQHQQSIERPLIQTSQNSDQLSAVAQWYAFAQKAAADTVRSIMPIMPQKTSESLQKQNTQLPAESERFVDKDIMPSVPTPPIIKNEERLHEKKKIQQYEDIQILMKKFKDKPNQHIVEKIISELSYFKDDELAKEDRADFMRKFNEYDQLTKKTFATFFFALPAGNLNSSGLPIYSCSGNQFMADITNDRIYIMNTADKKIIFASHELDNNIKTMTFDVSEQYLAIGYDTDDARIEVLEKTEEAFKIDHTIISKDFSRIIGLKFITTSEKNTYLFFIDTNYTIGMYDFLKIKTQSKKEAPEKTGASLKK